MSLLVGTDRGLYRLDRAGSEPAEHVLDCGPVRRIKRCDAVEEVYVTAAGGLYRSAGGLDDWQRIGVDDEELFSVTALAGGVLFAGDRHSTLYRSDDRGRNWQEVTAFDEVPSRDCWRAPTNPYAAFIRVVVNPPGSRQRLVVGVEAGGLHLSDDGGRSWTELRSPRLRRRSDDEPQDDVHHIHPLGPDTWLVPTGRLDVLSAVRSDGLRGDAGLFLTRDAGVSWERLDRNFDGDYPYCREVILHEDTLYYCGSHTRPSFWRQPGQHTASSRLFTSEDLGATWTEESFPGGPDELVMAWTADDGGVIGGTGSFEPLGPGETFGTGSGEDVGRLIERTGPGEWSTLAELPSNVHALLSA